MSCARCDVVVLGGGPAGLSAAIWCADLGLSCVVLEASAQTGGQLHAVPHPVRNLPGCPDADAGALARAMYAQAVSVGVGIELGAAARLEPRSLRAYVGDRAWDAGAVILATGVRRRRLDVPGERSLLGRGVRFNAGEDLALYRGARAVVIGGGDDALVHALQLAAHALEVTVVHWRASVTARSSLAEQARGDARIRWVGSATVEAFEGARELTAVLATTPHGALRIEADFAFVCAGPVPNSEGFGVETSADGAVIVDRLQRTSRAGVYAVGDVCCSEAPTVSTALGHGAVAAKAISAMSGDALRQTSATRDEDTLRVRGLELPARVGAYARELGHTQTLRFDLEFPVDARSAAAADRLERTLDYAVAAEVITDVLSRRHYALVESVADTVASELLARFSVREVTVEVTKLGVPQEGSEAAVRVRRSRRG